MLINPKTMVINEVTLVVVATIISKINVKSTGPGEISPRVLKTIFPYFDTLVYLFNDFLSNGIFLQNFKQALIVRIISLKKRKK